MPRDIILSASGPVLHVLLWQYVPQTRAESKLEKVTMKTLEILHDHIPCKCPRSWACYASGSSDHLTSALSKVQMPFKTPRPLFQSHRFAEVFQGPHCCFPKFDVEFDDCYLWKITNRHTDVTKMDVTEVLTLTVWHHMPHSWKLLLCLYLTIHSLNLLTSLLINQKKV